MTGPPVLRGIRAIYSAMLAGQLVFALAAIVLVITERFKPNPIAHFVMQFAVPLLSLLFGAAGVWLYSWRIRASRDLHTLSAKLQSYQVAFVMRCAVLQGVNLFVLVAYIQTGQPVYWVYYFAVVFVYLFRKPSAEHAATSLHLSDAERNQLLSES